MEDDGSEEDGSVVDDEEDEGEEEGLITPTAGGTNLAGKVLNIQQLGGLPADGMWEAALRLHNKKREGSIDDDDTINTSRNVPSSMIPFVQG